MPALVTLESRFPLIIAELAPRTDLAVKASSEYIAALARSQAPVVTGRLKESIHVESRDEGYAVVADAMDDAGYPYAVVVEYGGHEGGNGTGPHAFLNPAAEQGREYLIEAVALSLRGL